MFSENDEWRKLQKHFNKWEGKRINEIIHNNCFKFNTYSENRIKGRNISEIDVMRTIKYGNIVEFHFKNNSPRVLVRGKEIVKGESICVVLDVRAMRVVTVYKNDFTDSHLTLHKELYRSNIDLMKYLNIN